MAVIPTYTRQHGIPATTGVSSPPVVLAVNDIAKSVGTVGTAIEQVGDHVFKAHAASEVSTATVNAQLKLSQMERDLDKLPGMQALGQHPQRAEMLYRDITKTMGPQVRAIFDQKWAVLSAKSQISVHAKATKRAYSKMEGDLFINLDALARGIGPNGNKVDSHMATTTGLNAIDDAMAGRVISPKAGAKLKLKFTQDIAENGVTGWLNRQTQGTMMSAFVEMDTESFTDPEVARMWSLLDEPKKAALTAKAITNLSRMLSFEDKEVTRTNKALASNAKVLMLEFYGPKTESARRTAILTELSKNKTVQIGTYNTMLKDNEGRSNRFDNQSASIQLKKRILMTPHLVTFDDIVEYSGSDVGDLMIMYNARLDARTKRAREIVKSSPAFVPSNMAEARIKGEVFDAAQADIWSKVLIEQTEARDQGKTFDPVARAKVLIKEFTDEQGNSGVTQDAALSTLNGLGIYTQQDLDIYMATNNLSFGEQNRLRGLARKAF